MPGPERRCDDCEAEYRVRLREEMGRHVIGAALALGSLSAVFIGVVFLTGSIVAVLPVAALCASAVVVLLSPGTVDTFFGRMLPRRRFLREQCAAARALAPGQVGPPAVED
jgi:hypothetical protein